MKYKQTMKKKYITPRSELVIFFSEDAMMATSPALRMDEESSTDVAWSQKKQGSWNSSIWNSLDSNTEE